MTDPIVFEFLDQDAHCLAAFVGAEPRPHSEGNIGVEVTALSCHTHKGAVPVVEQYEVDDMPGSAERAWLPAGS